MNRQNIRKNLAYALVAAISLTTAAASHALTLNATVDATDGPWLYANGGLNTNFQYGEDDQKAPLVLSAANGLAFVAGTTLDVEYVIGSTNEGGFASPDANGDSVFVFNANTGNSGKVAPSAYFDPATYPAYLGVLSGTFADSSGTIIGTPFKVGDSLSIVIPAGATQLQLGVNDDIYSDNTGAYQITVTGAGVPEPSALALVSLTAILAGTVGLRRRSGNADRAVMGRHGAGCETGATHCRQT